MAGDTQGKGNATAPIARPGTKIVLSAVAGVGLVVAFMWVANLAYAKLCKDSKALFCALPASNPPWLLLSGLAAVPSALLTWHWRTKQRDRELSVREGELHQRLREHEQRGKEFAFQTEHQAARTTEFEKQLENATQATQVASKQSEVARAGHELAIFETATRLLNSDDQGERLAGVALAQHLATVAPSWTQAVVDGLCALARTSAKLSRDEDSPADVRAAFTAVGALTKHDDVRIDLRDCVLVDVQVKDAAFRGANLSNTYFEIAVFEDCDFSRSNLTEAEWHCISVDGSSFEAAYLGSAKVELGAANSANFARSYLIGTSVSWTEDRDLHFEGAIYDTKANFSGPSDWSPEQAGMIRDDSSELFVREDSATSTNAATARGDAT